MKRDLGQEILEGIRAIKRGEGRRYTVELPIEVIEVRAGLNLTQEAFASLMGVNVRTLQDWEQGRRKPTGPALSLLKIVKERPDVFPEVFLKNQARNM